MKKKIVKQPTKKLYEIKTTYKELVDGKNKKFTKSFVIVGTNEKNALETFYADSYNGEYVVKEIKKLEVKKGE